MRRRALPTKQIMALTLGAWLLAACAASSASSDVTRALGAGETTSTSGAQAEVLEPDIESTTTTAALPEPEELPDAVALVSPTGVVVPARATSDLHR